MSDVYVSLKVSGEQEVVAGIVKIQDALVSLQRYMELMVGSMSGIDKAIQGQLDKYIKLKQNVPPLFRDMANELGILDSATEKWAKSTEGLNTQYEVLQKMIFMMTGIMLPDLDFGMIKTDKSMDKVSKKIIEVATNLSELATALSSLFGTLGDDHMKKVASGFANIFSGIADIASLDPVKIITGVIKVIDGLIKVFSPNWEKRAKNAFKGLAGVTDEMTASLAKLAEETKDTDKAFEKLLGEFIKSANMLDAGDFEGWAGKVSELGNQTLALAKDFNKLKEEGVEMVGAVTTIDDVKDRLAEMADNLGKAFQGLVTRADEFKLHGTKAMVEIIDKARKLKEEGVKIPEVFEYVEKKLAEGGKALKTYLGTFADTGAIKETIAALNAELAAGNLTIEETVAKQDELTLKQQELSTATADVTANWDFMQVAAMSTFHALEAQGHSFVEIVGMMQEQLSGIGQMAQDNGLEISEGLQAMTNLSTFISQNEELATRIDSTRIMMEALGDSAFLTGNDFAMFAAQTGLQFEQIMAKTSDQEMALRLIGPALEDLIKYSESYGYTIDDNTQALIDQAQEEGVLAKEQKSHHEVTNDLLMAIAEALGAKIPDSLKKMTGEFEGSMDKIQNETGKWDSGLARVEDRMRKGLPDAVRGLDREYKERMTGHSIVTETDKWKYSLEEVEEKLGRDLIDTTIQLDKKYAPMMKDVSRTMNNGREIAAWTPEETQRIRTTPIARMNLSDQNHEGRKGDIVFEHITIQSENGDETVKEFMTAIKGNKYGVQNLIRKVTN